MESRTVGSRRKLLKKAGIATVFVAPAIMTFSVSELQAKYKPSGVHDNSDGKMLPKPKKTD
jgi:hypothetical protein